MSKNSLLLRGLHQLLAENTLDLPVDYTQLTPSERRSVREQYIRNQKDLCWFCKSNLHADSPKKITNKPINWALFPDNFTRYPIHLQHDHETGLTEGAVHAYCNAVLWQYEGK